MAREELALRIVVDARKIAPINATNAITIKDTPERIEAAARLLAAIDKAVIRFRKRGVEADVVGLNQASATLLDRVGVAVCPPYPFISQAATCSGTTARPTSGTNAIRISATQISV